MYRLAAHSYRHEKIAYEGMVSVEMLPQASGNEEHIRNVLSFVKKHYA